MAPLRSTPTTPAPIALVPCLQRYAWGDRSFIPEQLGRPVDGRPCAEAWYGAHPMGPSRCAESGAALDGLVAERGAALLGTRVADRFGELPYLLKLLAAAQPLSIQVHPDADQAAAGFARENAAGIAGDAVHRNYRDPRPKPELIVALTAFEALCGFRSPAAISEALAGLPELHALVPAAVAGAADLRALLAAWFAAPEADLVRAQSALLERLAGAAPASLDAAGRLALRLHDALPTLAADRGLLFVWLLEHQVLAPGQGLYLPAGVPHAYLAGAGIEVMGSSDNVLRAGLTPKHVDPDELLAVVRCDAPAPRPIDPCADADGADCWHTGAVEFELARLAPGPDGLHCTARGPETLLVLGAAGAGPAEVQVTLDCAGERRTLNRGDACLVPHGVDYRLDGGGAHVWRVRVPGG